MNSRTSDEFAVPVGEQAHIDRWTRQIWAVSQRDRMIISLAGELQGIVDAVREAAGLPELT